MPGTRQWINSHTQVCDLDITGTGSQCLEPASGSTVIHRYVTLTLLVRDLNAWNPPVDQQTDTGRS